MSQDRTKNQCKDCHFWEPPDNPNAATCHRYPKAEITSGFHWCGEFVIALPSAMELQQAIENEIKRRGS